MTHTALDIVALLAIFISMVAIASHWRTRQRARQEANILMLTTHMYKILDLMDDNLVDVLESKGKVKLKKTPKYRRRRTMVLQKMHMHLDSIEMMIKMETSAFMCRCLGKEHTQYYRELMSWYCSIFRLYTSLLKTLDRKHVNMLHVGTKDEDGSRQINSGKLPPFLDDHPYAHKIYNNGR